MIWRSYPSFAVRLDKYDAYLRTTLAYLDTLAQDLKTRTADESTSADLLLSARSI